ncbi:unnamed protein product [Discula destructiva]
MAITGLSAIPTPNIESDEDFDLFSDDVDPHDLEIQRTLQQRAELARREKLAQLPAPSRRTCAQNRTAYVLSGRRLQPTKTSEVFTVQECEHVMVAVVDFVHSQGGLHTERHEAFATTDVPVSSLTLPSQFPDMPDIATGDAVQQRVSERVLGPLAEATGFSPHHLGLKDLFVVCYRGKCSTPEQQVKQYPIPSQQASLAIHSDGCLLSFSLLLNHSDAFEGGGTFFKGTGQTFHLKQGGLLMHDAGLEHAGAEVISGQRIILVGFVDTVDVLKEKRLWEEQSTRRRPHGQIASCPP